MLNLYRTALLTSLFTLALNAIYAQNIALGFNMQEESSMLTTQDAKFDDGRYYKNLTYSMKAGESTMFYMIAAQFEPMIYTIDTMLQTWSAGRNEMLNFNLGSVQWITAKRDTTFYVVYSSAYAATTGEFIYGIRTVTGAQQNYAAATSSCDRLNYVINNWQLFNGFFPPAEGDYGNARATQNTWMPGRIGTISNMSSYTETLFKGDTEATEDRYRTLVQEIKNCLNSDQWVSREEIYDDTLVTFSTYTTTYFTVNGASEKQAFNSMALVRVVDSLGQDQIYLQLY